MRRALLFGLFLLLLPGVIASAGVRGPSLEDRSFDFEPGKVIEITFSIYGSNVLNLLVKGGKLLDYAEIVDPNPDGGPRNINVRIVLPDYLPPGEHIIYVGAVEQASKGMIGARAGALMSIRVKVLSDEPVVKLDLTVNDAGNDLLTTTGTLKIQSWSKQDMTVDPEIRILDLETDKQYFFQRLPQQTLASNEEISLPITLPVKTLSRGYYHANATVYYSDNKTSIERLFRVGTKQMFLENYSPDLTAGKINKFTFKLRSDWNQRMEGVYGVVKISNGISARSVPIDMNAFETSEFAAFLDMGGDTGEFQGTITAYFLDSEQSWPINVTVIDEETPATAIAEEPAVAASGGIYIPLNTMTLLYFLLILLVIINLILLFKKKNDKGKKE